MGFANRVLCGIETALGGSPSIGIEAADVKRRSEFVQWEKHLILPSPKDIRQHGATVMIHRMPEPPRLGFLADITPHLVELGAQSTRHLKLIRAPDFHLDVLRV